MIIDSCDSLEQAAIRFGILPFFRNPIRGFSVEEMAAPGMLFGGFDGYEGCWEWKGPVIREQTTAYGKFFKRKAGFVALDLLPDFLNFRRNSYPLTPGSIEETILEIINEHEGLTSTELRKIILGSPGRKQTEEGKKPSRSALEGPLQRLQMGGRLLIADFEYKMTKKGEPYGWGVALYSTPEIWFENSLPKTERTPDESFRFLVSEISKRLPGASQRQISELIK